MSNIPFEVGETVFIYLYKKLQKGVIRYFWGNGDAQIKLEGLKQISRPPDKIYHKWDVPSSLFKEK